LKPKPFEEETTGKKKKAGPKRARLKVLAT
jgi:hypothetical protein